MHVAKGCLFESCARSYASLPQKPRSDSENKIFKDALGVMGSLYGSLTCTTVIQIKDIPPAPAGFQYNDRGYNDRGWCCFEDDAAKI